MDYRYWDSATFLGWLKSEERRPATAARFDFLCGALGASMPKGRKGQKRPADVISNAITMMKIATGELEEGLTDDGKNKARKGGCCITVPTGTANMEIPEPVLVEALVGDFCRKVARPAGLEPATIGLEGRKCCDPEKDGKRRKIFRINGSFSGRSRVGRPAAPGRRVAAPPARPTTGPRRAIPPPRPTPPPRRPPPPTPPRVASGAGGGPDLGRGGRPETDAPHGRRGR